MIEPRLPKFQWGQRVLAVIDLYNDGSYPEQHAEALLVAAGSQGEIVNIGRHEDANIPVYMVEFAGGAVVGCLEEELRLAVSI